MDKLLTLVIFWRNGKKAFFIFHLELDAILPSINSYVIEVIRLPSLKTLPLFMLNGSRWRFDW